MYGHYGRGIGYVAGYNPYGGHDHYVVGVGYPRVVGADAPHAMLVHPPGAPNVVAPPWRPMVAPGTPPVGEGHVPMPLNPDTNNGTWGANGAAAGTQITFSARPQKPFKMTRVLARTNILVNSGGTANGTPIAQIFIGTNLQQAELGYIDLATIGAGGAFDTWLSLMQAEPGVWIRFQVQLTAYPTSPDSLSCTLTGIGHYLH